MGDPASDQKMSRDEYLAFERAATERHEYGAGVVFAMAGGTYEHSVVAANLVAQLTSVLRGGPCRPLTSDMRVNTASGRYFYPDASVVCGAPRFEDAARDSLLNPSVIFEVLSDTTEAHDRGEKFSHYEGIASVQEYVLISQKAPRVEVLTRQADQSWVRRVYGPGQRALLGSLGCEIPIDEIFVGALDQAPR